MDLWHRVLTDCDPDAALVHNHFCLNDTRLLELLPQARRTGTGIVNGSPFASGLLTDEGPAKWHPAGPDEQATFRRAAECCRANGDSISRLALQFASQHSEIPTTLFSAASAALVARNVAWHEDPYDSSLLAEVQDILARREPRLALLIGGKMVSFLSGPVFVGLLIATVFTQPPPA